MNYKIIQTMQLPVSEAENYGLYYRGTGGIRCCMKKRGLILPAGEQADFFTYFNGCYLSRWRETADIADIRIKVSGEGDFRLSFCHAFRKKGRVHSTVDLVYDWRGSGERCFVIPQWNLFDPEACFLKAEGRQGESVLQDFVIEAAAEQVREVRLAVVICTYKREEEVKRNLAAMERMREIEGQPRPAVFLVDNGNTLSGERFPDFIRYLPNKNCGGTGGFTRGILEAVFGQEGPFTHVVLMDDDVLLDPGTVEKTIRYLSFLKPEYTERTLCGSLIRRDAPRLQYENGALWNRGKIMACRHEADLGKRSVLLENMQEQKADYGGWWYCCFPAEVFRKKGLPLPLFVHRDDIEYGMRSGNLLSMNGIGVWHEAFEEKLPQTGEYYDIRNMAIVNAIYLEDWTKREWKLFLCKWTAGNLLRGRYEYVRLNMHGALDFLKGAEWLKNTDAVLLHQKVGALLSPLKDAQELRGGKDAFFWTSPGVSVYTAARKRKIIYEDSSGRCLAVKKSLREALFCIWLLYKTERKTDRCFERARQSYRLYSQEMTTVSFWKKYLEMEKK